MGSLVVFVGGVAIVMSAIEAISFDRPEDAKKIGFQILIGAALIGVGLLMQKFNV